MTTVTNYITQCLRLLHDTTDQFYSQSELVDYINDARLRVVRDTGCLRVLQTSYVTQSQENYPYGTMTGATVTAGGSGYTTPTIAFSGGGTGVTAQATATLTVTGGAITGITITSPGSGYTQVPTYVITGVGSGATIATGIIRADTIDIVNFNVIWGATRLMLDQMPWSNFNYYLRGWQLLQGRPVAMTIYGQNSISIGPPPDQTYAVEIDSVVQPYYFTGPTDVTLEAIPVPFQSPVAYYACYAAKERMQQWQEAEWFRTMYQRQVISALNSAYTRRLGRGI